MCWQGYFPSGYPPGCTGPARDMYGEYGRTQFGHDVVRLRVGVGYMRKLLSDTGLNPDVPQSVADGTICGGTPTIRSSPASVAPPCQPRRSSESRPPPCRAKLSTG